MTEVLSRGSPFKLEVLIKKNNDHHWGKSPAFYPANGLEAKPVRSTVSTKSISLSADQTNYLSSQSTHSEMFCYLHFPFWDILFYFELENSLNGSIWLKLIFWKPVSTQITSFKIVPCKLHLVSLFHISAGPYL